MFKHSLQVFDVSLGRVTVGVPSSSSVKMCKHWLGCRTLTFDTDTDRRSFGWQTRKIQRLLTHAHRCQCSSAPNNNPSSEQTLMRQKMNFKEGPSLHHFIANSSQSTSTTEPASVHHDENADTDNVPYLSRDSFDGNQRKGFVLLFYCLWLRCRTANME